MKARSSTVGRIFIVLHRLIQQGCKVGKAADKAAKASLEKNSEDVAVAFNKMEGQSFILEMVSRR